MYQNDYMLSRLVEERQRDLLRELEHDWLIREVRNSNAHGHTLYHGLDWVGRQLVRWGERLQARHAMSHHQAITHTTGGRA
jgi:hypothetical protein